MSHVDTVEDHAKSLRMSDVTLPTVAEMVSCLEKSEWLQEYHRPRGSAVHHMTTFVLKFPNLARAIFLRRCEPDVFAGLVMECYIVKGKSFLARLLLRHA